MYLVYRHLARGGGWPAAVAINGLASKVEAELADQMRGVSMDVEYVENSDIHSAGEPIYPQFRRKHGKSMRNNVEKHVDNVDKHAAHDKVKKKKYANSKVQPGENGVY